MWYTYAMNTLAIKIIKSYILHQNRCTWTFLWPGKWASLREISCDCFQMWLLIHNTNIYNVHIIYVCMCIYTCIYEESVKSTFWDMNTLYTLINCCFTIFICQRLCLLTTWKKEKSLFTIIVAQQCGVNSHVTHGFCQMQRLQKIEEFLNSPDSEYRDHFNHCEV